ncbi:MAG: DUF3316 domain-containing protein [Dysgonamonadaceae bacterium]|jgi:hypothetical protein|nr:DUF3316 domain-containing protein [Dysgonamonadaceae bacterium]
MRKVMFFVLLVFPALLCAQENEMPVDLSYRSAMIGIGSYSLYDTYLSGQRTLYRGWGVRILEDDMKMTRLLHGRVSSQQLVNFDFSSTKNTAKTATNYSLFLDYSYGLHVHFKPLPNLRLLAGPQVNVFLGAIYNTRNGNNPVSPKVTANLGFSGIADYRFRIKKQALAVRYQLDIPLAGGMFSQDYGASFYEISLGNRDGLFLFASLHNQWILKNYLTIELPLRPFTVRLSQLCHLYRTDVRSLQTHINSNALMIGLVKEFYTIPARKQVKGGKYRRVFD